MLQCNAGIAVDVKQSMFVGGEIVGFCHYKNTFVIFLQYVSVVAATYGGVERKWYINFVIFDQYLDMCQKSYKIGHHPSSSVATSNQ